MKTFTRLIFAALLVTSAAAWAQQRMITHVTRNNGSQADFNTQLILTNPGNADAHYTLFAYDITGTQIGQVSSLVGPGLTEEHDISHLFSSTEVSHILISDSTEAVVSVAYASAMGGSPAHLAESGRQAHAWRFFPGDWNTVIDGMAVVNSSDETVDITVRQKNYAGVVIDEAVIAEDLGPWAKTLYVMDEDFSATPGSYFEVSSSASCSVVALRFERPNSHFLWQNLTLEFETPREPEPFRVSAVVQWNEALLSAVRNGSPRPTVVTRALFLTQTAVYDAWSLFDDVAIPYRLDAADRRPASERTAANKLHAVNQAYYHMALHLFPAYETSTGVFSRLMADLGSTPVNAEDETAAGIGYAAAQAAIAAGQTDGSNAAGNFAQVVSDTYPQLYTPTNSDDPSADNSVGKPGFNPAKWVPLRVPNGKLKDANGVAILDHNDPTTYTTQSYLTPHWGAVHPFALTGFGQFRPAAPPMPGSQEAYTDALGNVSTNDAAFNAQVDEVLEISENLNDTQKAIAEFWADGPRSETPPGHWNAIAHGISERDRHTLDEDVKMYFALTAAIYDGGIAAWEAKRFYDFVRPVSAIRHRYFGQNIHAWGGPNRGTVEMLGEAWNPYQSPTFVTPPFPEYVSGHSTFSAAAAEVLTSFTGSNQFYDGVTRVSEDFNRDGVLDYLGQHIVGIGGNAFESTPTSIITLRWLTFQDAADEAGISRLYGGIHFQDGDRRARVMGQQIGEQAYAKAESYWKGTVTKK